MRKSRKRTLSGKCGNARCRIYGKSRERFRGFLRSGVVMMKKEEGKNGLKVKSVYVFVFRYRVRQRE
ncbi:MAG TPA: hypothetical protein DCE65_02925 [Clostridiales bacterium]|nr:hypothetical protein [Clostridiales bacterium]